MHAIARTIASHVLGFPLITLSGDLGAGKTYLAGLIIKTLNPDIKIVPSPTFSIINTYDTKSGKVNHCDLYRIGDTDELYHLGLLDILKHDIAIIEWPDIAHDLYDDRKRMMVNLYYVDERTRSVIITYAI